ncbi:hypothetical protein KP509_02G049100 [Ceratopteris richardii]|uniref:Uncharacterized protein n=1 Tax=Ceratopteris richardii TaxID=49495 RepID=A0A8T2VDB5_CERRI|nr:hypothetical protein KP509_02G049100 [Ceratopteris richardii]
MELMMHVPLSFCFKCACLKASTLRDLEEVTVVEQDTGVLTQTTHTPIYLELPHGAWKETGGEQNAGEGIVIGIIDTGIYPHHPSFLDNTQKPYPNVSHYKGYCEVTAEFPEGSCNKKLVGARHFAAAAIATGKFNASIDFASPFDVYGHGTHTASTAAGNHNVAVEVNGLSFGFASGMAPRAHIAVYKALYKGIGGFKADVLAAIEQAVSDNVDILNLSFGISHPSAGIATFFNALEIAMLSAASANVFVAHSVGNGGPEAQTVLSFSPWICSVAASLHDRIYTKFVTLGNHATIQATGLAPGTPGSKRHPLILARDALKRNSTSNYSIEECQNSSFYDEMIVAKKVMICTYSTGFVDGSFTVEKLVRTVEELSGLGVVIISAENLYDEIDFPMAPLSFPAAFILTKRETAAILNYYNGRPNHEPKIRIHGTNTEFTHSAPIVASFSSRGPDSANDHFKIAEVLKPTIMAPGKDIWAAWSPIADRPKDFKDQRFAILSGTSMAAPHIAGIAALMKQKNPQLSPAALQSALATTAFTTDKFGNDLKAQNPSGNVSTKLGPATYFDYGAGAVDATAALDPGLIFDAGKQDFVDFLCTISGAPSIVKATTGIACDNNKFNSQLKKEHQSSSSGSMPSSFIQKPTDLNLPSITIANLTATLMASRKVTSVGKKIETYIVTVNEPKGVSVRVKPMKFTIKPQETKELALELRPLESSGHPSFGHIKLCGNKGHSVVFPVSVVSKVLMEVGCA